MSKNEPPKPSLMLTALGAFGHGRTSVVAALQRVSRSQAGQNLPKPPLLWPGWLGVHATPFRYESKTRRYIHYDCFFQSDQIKNLIVASPWLSGCFVVVAAPMGLTPQAEEEIRVAGQLGFPTPVIFLNMVDMVQDQELLDRLEVEIRESLYRCGFSGDDAVILRGSAKAALRDKDPEIGLKAIERLLEALDVHLPTPRPEIDDLFVPIQKVILGSTTQGVVVTLKEELPPGERRKIV